MPSLKELTVDILPGDKNEHRRNTWDERKNLSIQNYQHTGKIKHILVSTVYNLQGSNSKWNYVVVWSIKA